MPIRRSVTMPQKADRAIHLHFEAGRTWRGLAGQSANEGSGVRATSHPWNVESHRAHMHTGTWMDCRYSLQISYQGIQLYQAFWLDKEASHECWLECNSAGPYNFMYRFASQVFSLLIHTESDAVPDFGRGSHVIKMAGPVVWCWIM